MFRSEFTRTRKSQVEKSNSENGEKNVQTFEFQCSMSKVEEILLNFQKIYRLDIQKNSQALEEIYMMRYQNSGKFVERILMAFVEF